MSSTKAGLKAAKAALEAQKYEDAANEARKALGVDANNYHANVFLGLALEKQDKNDEAEKAYETATRSKGKDPLAWQGLINLYEKQAGKKIDQYRKAALRLAEHYMEVDDKTRCQIVVDKYVGFVKQHGTRSQYKDALEMMLPTSTLYDYLEGRFPNPAYIYTKVVEIIETEEKERINREIGERRTRLGAKIGQVTNDVKREVLESSNLEHLYGCIINWTIDDDLRRQYEEKVLQRAYDTLAVLSLQRKEDKRIQVMKLAEGLVILKHPFALAWMITLEWKDVEAIDQLDPGLLREYAELFPNDGLSKVLRGYMGSEITPFPKPPRGVETDETEMDDIWSMSANDRLFLMTEGAEESSRSVISQRLMGEYYLYLEEYSSAVECAKKARESIGLGSQISGLEYQNNVDAVNIILATALIHHQTPRNHPEARALFDGILARKATNSSALIGVGLILEEEEDYKRAALFLDKALEWSLDVKVRAESAWCKAMNGDWEAAIKELEDCLPDLDEPDTRTKALKSQTLYRIGMCIWNLNPSRPARKDRNGAYSKFLSSLQVNLNFAPAYTILGIYYADYGKDRKRARKCFQKAFELSPSEVIAAERLARTFANEREWDLVEVVAQRVVESGKTRPSPGSKRKGISWPYAALGVCQLNTQDYVKSIVSFQSALRISPEDYHCWVGLGESYHNSGRYIAATKAFELAQKLETSTGMHTEDTWFSRYMLANVRRELGDHEEAIAGYENVLASKPTEFGVAIALLQTHVESAWRSIELSFFGRAAGSAIKAIAVARDLVGHRPDAFNLWKAVGDACSIFSWIQGYVEEFPLHDVCSILRFDISPEMFDQLTEFDSTGAQVLESMASDDHGLERCIQASILAQKRLIHICVQDIHAQAVAWYNLGWTEYRAHVVLAKGFKEPSGRKGPQYLKASVRCFKRAIELEAGNTDFWNALAIVTTPLNPKVAQHAFVRSLYLNDKSARAWTNLGTLYLLQQDTQLANEAFTRAQSTDPEYAHAWVGQGVLALLHGEIDEARSLFTHAFEIADSTSTITKRLYTSSTFDDLSSQTATHQASDILQPMLALNQLRAQTTTDLNFDHLQAFFAERVGASHDAKATLEVVCSQVEAEYELSESPLSLARFAQAKADLARAHLEDQDFDAAISNTEISLDLSADDDSTGPICEARRKYRLSAHLTAGLAHYYQGQMDRALSMFRTALEETNGSPDAICLLAQVLWAKGGADERAVAREQLLDCVEKHPDHAGAIMLLGAIAMLDDDRDTMDAVIADLHELRTRDGLSARDQRKVGRLLAALARAESAPESAEMVEAMTAVMLAPWKPSGWSQLADVGGEVGPRDMALLTAVGNVRPRGELEAEDLARVFAGTGRAGDARRGVMMAPWVKDGWEGLGGAG